MGYVNPNAGRMAERFAFLRKHAPAGYMKSDPRNANRFDYEDVKLGALDEEELRERRQRKPGIRDWFNSDTAAILMPIAQGGVGLRAFYGTPPNVTFRDPSVPRNYPSHVKRDFLIDEREDFNGKSVLNLKLFKLNRWLDRFLHHRKSLEAHATDKLAACNAKPPEPLRTATLEWDGPSKTYVYVDRKKKLR